MAIVYTDNIKEDMVLSEEVKDIKGRLLLKEGQKIEPKHIRILMMWGITEVNIVGEAGMEEASESDHDPQITEEIAEDTRRIFSHVDLEHPAMSEIFRLSVLFRSRNKTSKQERPSGPSEYNGSAKELKPDIRKKITCIHF